MTARLGLEQALSQFIAELDLQLKQQTSDRATAVCALAGLDYVLEFCLRERLNQDLSDADFTGTNAVFGTTSAKIRVAFAIGLISADEQSELNLLRRIRNEFAHRIGSTSFDEPPAADRCRSLRLCDRLYLPDVPVIDLGGGQKGIPTDLDNLEKSKVPVVSLDFPAKNDPRSRFVTSTLVMSQVLTTRWMSARVAFETPAEFENVLELVEHQLITLDDLFKKSAIARSSIEEAIQRASALPDGVEKQKLLDDLLKIDITEDARSKMTYAISKYARLVFATSLEAKEKIRQRTIT